MQNDEFLKLKGLVSDIAALQYYDVSQPVVIECDASSYGLGAAVFQKGGVVGYASRTLTSTEKNYAQIEKELLAIVFACTRYDQLVVGNPRIIIKTDHKPLINIFNKPLLTAPKRLQHMLLNLQRYNLEIQYVTGKQNVVADALSRVPFDDDELKTYNKLNIFRVFRQLENLDLSSYLSVSDSCLENIVEATSQDAALQNVLDYIRNGWPRVIGRVPANTKIYFKYRGELSTQDGLIFRNDRIVIPHSIQRSMVDRVHVSHNGIESTLKLARENVFWPGMSSQIIDVVKECQICAKYAPSQPKPPMQTHAIPIYPWQVVSMDVFFADYAGRKRNFLVTVDHYSDFVELDILKDLSGKSTVETCRVNFSRHGSPQLVITDNGTNFINEEMKEMARIWNFEHSTSAPNHQQANGKAEAAVKTMKRLILKAEDTGENLWYTLLHWRNTPNKIGRSPVNRLFSRSTRCGVPAVVEKYIPNVTEAVPEAIAERRKRTKYYYDRKTRELPTLQTGDPVLVQLHPENSKTWTSAVVDHKLNDRSYVVNAGGSSYRRDLVHIKPRKEPETCPILQQASQPKALLQLEESRAIVPVVDLALASPRQKTLCQESSTVADPKDSEHRGPSEVVQPEPPGPPLLNVPSTINATPTISGGTRPKRERKIPSKLKDFVLDQ